MNAFWVILILVALMIAEVKFFDFTALKHITYRRYFSKKAVFEGDKLQMVEVIQNGKITPVPWLRVESRISSYLRFKSMENLKIDMEMFHRSVFFLRGFRRVTRKHEITCIHRGVYHLTQTSVTAGDLFFGMVFKTKEFPSPDELIVYPQIPSAAELPDLAIAFLGDVSARRWIMDDPVLVNGIRDYRLGDNQRDIHWAATARAGELMVKVRDFTVTPKVLVILNSQSSETLWSVMAENEQAIIEEGIRISAGIIAEALDKGFEAGFASNCTSAGREGETVYIPPVKSDGQLEAILDAMARILIVRQMNFHTFLDGFISDSLTGLDIAIISAYTSDSLEARMEELRGMGNTVSLILISGEAKEAVS